MSLALAVDTKHIAGLVCLVSIVFVLKLMNARRINCYYYGYNYF